MRVKPPHLFCFLEPIRTLPSGPSPILTGERFFVIIKKKDGTGNGSSLWINEVTALGKTSGHFLFVPLYTLIAVKINVKNKNRSDQVT